MNEDGSPAPPPGFVPLPPTGGYDVQGNAAKLRAGQKPETIAAPEPPPWYQGMGSGIADYLGNAVKSAPAGMLHMARVIAGDPTAEGQDALAAVQQMQAEKQAGYSQKYRAAAYLGNGLGVNVPAIEQAAKEGKTGEILGQITVPTAAAIAPLAIEGAAKLRPPKAPPTIETVSRNITNAVNPLVEQWPGYMRATQDVGGQVIDFGNKAGIDTSTQLGYSKAARAMAKDASNHFNEKILGPFQNDQVSVAGTGYRGPKVGEGQTAKLGDINKRLGQINNELRPAYVKGESGKVLTAIANEADLLAEQKGLTDILHKELATRTGLQPEQIADLRKTIGKAYTIADQTERAVNARQSAVSRSKEGAPSEVPTTLAGTAKSAINKLRGGPEAISDRAFRKATSGLTVQGLQLPEPIAPLTLRAQRAAEKIMQTKALPPGPIITPPPPTEMDFINMRDRLTNMQPLLPAGNPPIITPPPPIDTPGSLQRAASVQVPDYSVNKMRTQYLTGSAVDQIMQLAKEGKLSPGEADRRIKLLGGSTKVKRPQSPPR